MVKNIRIRPKAGVILHRTSIWNQSMVW